MNTGLFRSKNGWVISSFSNESTGETPPQPEEPEEPEEPEDEPNIDWWDQCEDCYENNWKPHLEDRIYLCEYCDKYLKLPSSDRIELLVEPRTWDPTDQNMVSMDPIEWDGEEPITLSKDVEFLTLSDEEVTTPSPSAKEKEPDYYLNKYLEYLTKYWKYFQHMVDVLERENEKTLPKLLERLLGDIF